MMQYLFWQNKIVMYEDLRRSMFSGFIVYFIAGHYFGNVIGKEELSGKKAVLYMALGFVAIVISCFMTKFMTNIKGMTGENDAQSFYSNLICIPTYAIFYLVRYLSEKYGSFISEWIKKVILTFGGAAFGVMLTENLWRKKLEFIFLCLKPYCKTFLSCIAWVLLTWFCASVATLFMKKIPCVGKLLR